MTRKGKVAEMIVRQNGYIYHMMVIFDTYVSTAISIDRARPDLSIDKAVVSLS